MSDIIICSDKSLDRSVDVTVNINKVQAETTTDLSVLMFATTDADFEHGANRVKYYNTFDEIKEDFVSSQEAYRAANAFFGQSPRAKTLAVGKIFTAAVAGFMKTKAIQSVLATWVAVTDGSFAITIDATPYDVSLCDFSGAADLDAVAAIIQARLQVAVAATLCVYENGLLKITSPTTGATSTLSALTAVDPAVGTDISGSGFMNGLDDQEDPTDDVILVPGYTPTGDIADELDYLVEAARCSGKFVYGWALERGYRDSSDQTDAAAWAEARTAILGLCLNSPLVLDAGSTSDVGYLLAQSSYVRTFSTYHNNAFYYPEVGILAQILSVNYAAENSTMTAKFKDISGIPTVPITTTELTVLNNKRVNTFTAVGNDARTFREGVEASTTWFIDDLTNLDNYSEELQTEVYNVFLQNRKVPYTAIGLTLIRDAIERISNRYVRNGTFSERPRQNTTGQANLPPIEPAYTITNTPLQEMTVSDRAQRVGPPFTVNVNLAGAIHSVDITVNAFA